MDFELGERLGLDVLAGTPGEAVSATGHDARRYYYLHNVQLTVGSHTFGAPVAFMASPTSYGLAGQQGFFSQFRVTFDLTAEELELAPVGR